MRPALEVALHSGWGAKEGEQQLYHIGGLDFAEAIRKGAQVNTVVRRTNDFREAVARFLKK